MNDFKVGDKVRIIAAEDTERYKNGDILTVSDLSYGEEVRHVIVTCADGKQELAYLREIEPYAPDVITINRADLPEITQKSDWLMDGDWAIGGAHMDASTASQAALRYLAAAEYLDARDKAAKDAERSRDKRRDELAAEVAKAGCYVAWPTYTYKDHEAATRAAIDMIIELDPSHD